jgi:oxygen-dependent protoporphyrinogen oxidase
MVVLRCFLGGAGGEQALARDDGSIVEDVLAELHALLGWRAQPAFTRLTRWPKSMAQYTVGHARRMEALRERLSGYPGLHLAGNAYEGIGIPDCVRLGRAAARAVRHARAFYT